MIGNNHWSKKKFVFESTFFKIINMKTETVETQATKGAHKVDGTNNFISRFQGRTVSPAAPGPRALVQTNFIFDSIYS